jgi:hypothetical protein
MSLGEQISAAEALIAAKREHSKVTFARSPQGLIRWRGVPWAGPHRARKATTCAWSGRAIGKGDLVFAPVSNGGLRMLRVLAGEWPE